jgi:hypothetical protein
MKRLTDMTYSWAASREPVLTLKPKGNESAKEHLIAPERTGRRTVMMPKPVSCMPSHEDTVHVRSYGWHGYAPLHKLRYSIEGRQLHADAGTCAHLILWMLGFNKHASSLEAE